MVSQERNLNNLFVNLGWQMFIPAYQRDYVWNFELIDKFLNDISNSTNDHNHFIGNIIVIQTNPLPGQIQYEIIDGQQRITTLYLMFLSIRNLFGLNMQFDNFLFSDQNNTILKLDCYQQNNNFLTNLVLHNVTDGESNLLTNYRHIFNYFRNNFSNATINNFIQKFNFIKVNWVAILQTDNLSTHQIFDSINSDGIDLEQSDLIRNYLMMGQPLNIQNEFYINYWTHWEDIASRLGVDLKTCFYHFCIYTLHHKIYKKRTYETFKNIFPQPLNLQLIGHTVNIFFNHLNFITNSNALEFSIWRDFDYKTSLPFICYLLQNNVENVNEWMSKINNICLRRYMCDMNTNDLTDFFYTAFNNLENPNSISNSHLWPRDPQILGLNKNRNFYSTKTQCVFRKINGNIPIQNLTIEHFAPQNPPNNSLWTNWIPNDYEQIINFLGNLTMLTPTGNNPGQEFNANIVNKIHVCINSGGHINNYFVQHPNLNVWDENAINQRGDQILQSIIHNLN